jgi:hypothetical protein
MSPRRPLPLIAAALSLCAVAVAAAALEPSLPTAPARPPPPTDLDPAGPSLLALLLRLLNLEGLLVGLTGLAGGAGGQSGLVATLGGLALVLGVALLVAFVDLLRRRRSAAASARSHERAPTDERERSGADVIDSDPGERSTPAHAVDRAWLALVASLSVERPEALTTGEIARRAVERGDEPDAVRTLADAVERVHYGGAPPASQAGRARASARRLDLAVGAGRGTPAATERDGERA